LTRFLRRQVYAICVNLIAMRTGIHPVSSPDQAFARKRHAPAYQACVKDKSRNSQSLRAANPLLLAGTIGKREPVSDRRPPPMKAGSSQPGPAAAKTDAGSRDLLGGP
jgi:hypothetical protein